MPMVKIGQDTYNDVTTPIYLMQGMATRDAEDKPVNDTDHAVVGIAAAEDKDGNTVYVNLNGWRDNYGIVRRICKRDSVLAIGKLTTREINGRVYYDLNADFVALNGAGFLGSVSADEPPKFKPAGRPVGVSAEDFDDGLGDLPDAEGFTELNDDGGELPF